jgi:hypothetical protein
MLCLSYRFFRVAWAVADMTFKVKAEKQEISLSGTQTTTLLSKE